MKWLIGIIALLVTTVAIVLGSETPASLEYEVSSVKRQLLLETDEGEIQLQAGDTVDSGDALRTGSRSKAEISVPDAAVRFSIGAKTRFKLAHNQPGVLLEIERGNLRAIFGKLPEGDSRERLVTTPSAVLAVRGTEYGVEVEKDGDTSIAVFEGTVEVWNPQDPGERMRLQAGLSTRVRRGMAPTQPRAHGISSSDWDQGRRRTNPAMGNSQQSPRNSSGGQMGSGSSGSSKSQGGSKRRGG